MRAPLPNNESERLAELYRYELLCTASDPSLDRITRLAARIFSAPISLLTLIDQERQFCKSRYGIDVWETPRDYAFCAHAILVDGPTVACDTTMDSRFADNPFVLGEAGIRFYCAAPLETKSGYRLGTLCVIDRQPRENPSPEHLAALEDLADQVVEILDFQRAKRELAEARDQLMEQARSLNESRELWRKTEQKATIALEAGGMGYWERDAATELITFSPAVEAMIGLDHESFDGSMEAWLRHVHPDDRQMIVNNIEKAKQSQQNYSMKYRPLTANGSERWITTTGTYKKDEKGNFAGAHGVSWDSTAAELAAREMKRREELFRGLVASAPVGVFRADGEGSVTFANSHYSAIFGMAEQEALGLHWRDRLHPEDRPALLESLAEATQLAGSWEYEHRLLMQDGAVRWVNVRVVFLRDQNRQIMERIGTVDDITQRRQAIEDLLEAKEAAEIANRTKDMFLANVSHELRTPLNGILGMNDLLLESELNAEQFEMAQLVKESACGLLTVVNDILDLNRIEAGKLSIEQLPLNVRNVVRQAVALFERDAIKKGLKLSTHYPANLPLTLSGDASRIKQILVNYLSNAIKFTAAGEIEIEVQSKPTDSGVELLLAVSDSGPGIKIEEQTKLFQPFSQVDGSSTRRNGGIGLGLAISRRLAELMGGSVGVNSTPGEGSIFWVRLPLASVAECPHGEELQSVADPKMRGRVLLVEDNPLNLRVAAGALARLGWEADVAASGRAAIDLFQKNDYALVLMDCQLPEMDGYAATRKIRQWEALEGRLTVPIVALTAHAMAGDRERCLAAGMNDYLPKPLGLEQLRGALQRWAGATVHNVGGT